METLAVMANRLSLEEKLDCASLLIEKVMTDTAYSALTPGGISLDADGRLRFGSVDVKDLTFCPPEVILSRASFGRSQALFNAGHILYWMLTGETVYDRLPVVGWKVLEATKPFSVGKMDGKLLSALQVMLHEDECKREGGIRLFLNYLTSSVKGILRMIPVINGKELPVVDFDFHGQLILHIRGTFSSGGADYRILKEQEVQYRPGIHTKRVDVAVIQPGTNGRIMLPSSQMVKKDGEIALFWMVQGQVAVAVSDERSRPLQRSFPVDEHIDMFVFSFGRKDGETYRELEKYSFTKATAGAGAKLTFHRKKDESLLEITWGMDRRTVQTFIADFDRQIVKEC